MEFKEGIAKAVEEKIKVESLDIIVEIINKKPYYSIKYKEVGKDHYNIGCSSFNLDFVLEWKEQCFEPVEEGADDVELTAEEAIRILGEVCMERKNCDECPVDTLREAYGATCIVVQTKHTDELIELLKAEKKKRVKPTISKRDRSFLDYISDEYKYMVRERSGNLWIYKCVPTKRIIGWDCEELLDYVYIGDMKVDFPMVKWEDKEPWQIEDLKKLEVEE